jgi:hypothetical protein
MQFVIVERFRGGEPATADWRLAIADWVIGDCGLRID